MCGFVRVELDGSVFGKTIVFAADTEKNAVHIGVVRFNSAVVAEDSAYEPNGFTLYLYGL